MSTLATIRKSKRSLGTGESGNAFLWGCAALVAIAIFVMLGIFVAAYFGISALLKYTSDEPIVLPPVEATIEEIDSVIARMDTFLENLDTGEAQEPLVLTEKDLNILVQHHPELEEIQDFVYLTLEDDEITGQLNVPLEFIPGLEKRYFTGVAKFDLEFRDERLEIFVKEAEVSGEAVPEKVMEEIRYKNLVDHAQSEHPDLREHLENVESITVAEGQITVVPKKQ